MTEQDVFDSLQSLNVVGTRNVSVRALVALWAGRSEVLVKAALGALGKLRKEMPNVELSPRGSGVSGYGPDRDTQVRKECFHIGVNLRPNALIIYRHGEVAGCEDFFKKAPPGNNKKRYGYLCEARLSELPAITRVLRESYRVITGK